MKDENKDFEEFEEGYGYCNPKKVILKLLCYYKKEILKYGAVGMVGALAPSYLFSLLVTQDPKDALVFDGVFTSLRLIYANMPKLDDRTKYLLMSPEIIGFGAGVTLLKTLESLIKQGNIKKDNVLEDYI